MALLHQQVEGALRQFGHGGVLDSRVQACRGACSAERLITLPRRENAFALDQPRGLPERSVAQASEDEDGRCDL